MWAIHNRKARERRRHSPVNVTQDIDGVQQAALELMVESLKEADVDRQVSNLGEDATPEQLAKLMPRRTLADAYYDYASYLLWIRGKLEAGVELEILADEADGLTAVAAAWQEYEHSHPACPRCRTRQYSSTAMRCRNSRCGLDFRKAS